MGNFGNLISDEILVLTNRVKKTSEKKIKFSCIKLISKIKKKHKILIILDIIAFCIMSTSNSFERMRLRSKHPVLIKFLQVHVINFLMSDLIYCNTKPILPDFLFGKAVTASNQIVINILNIFTLLFYRFLNQTFRWHHVGSVRIVFLLINFVNT